MKRKSRAHPQSHPFPRGDDKAGTARDDSSPVDHTANALNAGHAGRTLPTGALLSATEAALLLGRSRRHFYNLKERFGLQPCAAGTKARPLYRREDVERVAKGIEPMPEHEWIRHFAHLPEVPDR